MVSEAIKELAALANGLCGGLLFLGLLLYLLRNRERNVALILVVLGVILLCLLNGMAVYFLL